MLSSIFFILGRVSEWVDGVLSLLTRVVVVTMCVRCVAVVVTARGAPMKSSLKERPELPLI